MSLFLVKKQKNQTRSSELFLSSSFAASEWILSRPLCPISPQRKGEIRTNFRSNLLHLSAITETDQHSDHHTIINTHTNTCIFTQQQHPFHCHHHQSGNTWPSRECAVQLRLAASWEHYSGNSDNTHQSVSAIYGALSDARPWCTFCSPCAMLVPVTPSGPPVEREGE